MSYINGINADFTACIVSGGEQLRRRITEAQSRYSQQSAEYFSALQNKFGRGFEESACGFLLLDNLLQKHDINRAELTLVRSSAGKPVIKDRNDIDLSISHSEGGALCCLAIGKDGKSVHVGADIQRVRTYTPEKLEKLAEVFMSKADFEQYLSSDRKEHIFYTLWTRREAYVKRIGGDIFVNTSDISLHTADFSGGTIYACGARYYYSINVCEE